MKVVVQRAKNASCTVDGMVSGAIDHGFVLLVGFGKDDDESVLAPMARKIIGLRIFDDGQGKMNLSLQQVGGSILSISQFTLYADCKKGNRPSFVQAASGETAQNLYDKFNAILASQVPVETGIFGADMKIALINDGPVTILLDSKEIMK